MKAVCPSIAVVIAADVSHMSDQIDAAVSQMEHQSAHRGGTPAQKPGRKYNEWWAMQRTPSSEWDEAIIHKLAGEIKQRHYSRKTLKAYADWSRKFQIFLKHKPPTHLSSDDVKAYLTHLAVTCKVSSSTQNQAFNALLFLFRHILKKDFGDHKDVPRAKRSSYIPVVLTGQEIDSVLLKMSYPYSLVVKLLYGCGLRLFECLKLRVQNFNFDEGMLTVMDGKGKKAERSRSRSQLCRNCLSSLNGSRRSMTRICMPDIPGCFSKTRWKRNIRTPRKEFIWQWFFPQQTLTRAETKDMRRYPLTTRMCRKHCIGLYVSQTHQTRNLPHLPPFICHPSASGQLSTFARFRKCSAIRMFEQR